MCDVPFFFSFFLSRSRPSLIACPAALLSSDFCAAVACLRFDFDRHFGIASNVTVQLQRILFGCWTVGSLFYFTSERRRRWRCTQSAARNSQFAILHPYPLTRSDFVIGDQTKTQNVIVQRQLRISMLSAALRRSLNCALSRVVVVPALSRLRAPPMFYLPPKKARHCTEQDAEDTKNAEKRLEFCTFTTNEWDAAIPPISAIIMTSLP